MSTPVWQPGTLYNPGAIVRRSSVPAVVAVAPTNPGFELGDTGWTKGTGWAIAADVGDHVFAGSWSAVFDFTGTSDILNDTFNAVTPGMSITATCQVQQGASSAGQAGGAVMLQWYDESEVLISESNGNIVNSGSGGAWHQSSVTATAPANAAFVKIGATYFRLGGGDELWCDNFSWNYAFAPSLEGLVFTAVQPDPGFSGATEPAWPNVLGEQVVDNEVIWEAINTSVVTWEANPILVSGDYEPIFPTVVGGTVADGTIKWIAVSRRVEDERCPNTSIVAIAASKIFCADEDIIAFSATVNALDWSTPDDAGYIPFGLQTYGANPVAALGLYRSNLVAFNSQAFQMWQVDPDPANMALLDAVPIACTAPKSVQPVQNDLVFLSAVGIRNIGIAGASTNLQAGNFGENIDPLVLAKIRAGEYEALGTYIPGLGQYWLFFGAEAFVLTITSAKDMSWGRYIFPEAVVAWTLLNNDLHLRMESGAVLKLSEEIEGADDVYCQPPAPLLFGDLDGDYEFMTLTWTAVELYGCDIESYRILRAANGGNYIEIGDVDGDTLVFIDTDLTSGVSYTYVVVARPNSDCGIDSDPSNVVDLDSVAPGPVVLSGEVVGTVEFDGVLTWTEATPGTWPIAEYRLYRSVDPAEYELIATVDAEATREHTDPYLMAEQLYLYYVIAVDTQGGISAVSNIVGLQPLTNVFVYTENDTWEKPEGLVSVQVTCIGGGGGGGSASQAPFDDSVKGGSGGGGGGGRSDATILAGDLAATVAVTVGAGGAGGAAVPTATTNGNSGAAGSASTFGAHLTAGGGGGGGRGSRSPFSNGAGGAGGTGTTGNGGAGGSGSTSASAANDGHQATDGGGGGGSGAGGLLTTTGGGGDGGAGPSTDTDVIPGGLGGISMSQSGDSGGDSEVLGAGSGGGGGYWAWNVAGASGAGGGGGLYGGGGGGGGFCSNSGTQASKGGDGAQGVVIVRQFMT